ncbi:MAG TPA: hypothetical protein VFG53_00085 [Anaeromyxobacter sp.]|nr:hypothetical protein [Anaeromyxobacter sp.]
MSLFSAMIGCAPGASLDSEVIANAAGEMIGKALLVQTGAFLVHRDARVAALARKKETARLIGEARLRLLESAATRDPEPAPPVRRGFGVPQHRT